jgi:hypothetical protein
MPGKPRRSPPFACSAPRCRGFSFLQRVPAPIIVSGRLILLCPGAGFMGMCRSGRDLIRRPLMQCGPFFAKSVPVWAQAAKITKNAVGVMAEGQLISRYARDADFCWVGVPGVYLQPPRPLKKQFSAIRQLWINSSRTYIWRYNKSG